MFIWIQCCSLQVSYTLLPENLKVFGTYLGTQLIWNINNQDTRLLKKGTRRINPKLRFLVLQRQKWIPHQLGKCSPTRSGHVQSQSVITYGKTSSIFLQDVDAAPLQSSSRVLLTVFPQSHPTLPLPDGAHIKCTASANLLFPNLESLEMRGKDFSFGSYAEESKIISLLGGWLICFQVIPAAEMVVQREGKLLLKTCSS